MRSAAMPLRVMLLAHVRACLPSPWRCAAFHCAAGPGVREHAFQKLAETMGEKLRLLDKKHVANARHEARVLTAVKSINHPCLLALQSAHTHRSAEGEDAMVIVTQRAGQELMDACGDGKMPFGTRLKIVQRLCDAMAALHAGGIVHRDIKPDNGACRLHSARVCHCQPRLLYARAATAL